MLLAKDDVHAFMPYPAALVTNAKSGALSGLTLGVKDIYDIEGYPTGCGQPTKLALSGIKTKTAPIVQRFLDRGARLVGKTHTVEMTYGMTGCNPHFGTPLNPFAPDRLPGGSSSGSASAVAAGLCDIGLGSDTGGSIRIPASFCGLYGIRPTHGRLPTEFSLPLAPSFDTPGWLTREPELLLRVTEAILEADELPITDTPEWFIAEDLFASTEHDASFVFSEFIERISGTLPDCRTIQVLTANHNDMIDAFRHIQAHEAWKAHGAFIEKYQPSLGTDIAERFRWASTVSSDVVNEARILRRQFTFDLRRLLGQRGILILPTAPGISPGVSSSESALEHYRAESLKLLILSGLSGFPQISLPLLTLKGAPLGVSLLGPSGSDRSLSQIAVKFTKDYSQSITQ